MSRCSVCNPILKVCRDYGPYPSDVLFLSKKPGRQEAFMGRIQVGDTGQELDRTYLPLAGLERGEVRCEN